MVCQPERPTNDEDSSNNNNTTNNKNNNYYYYYYYYCSIATHEANEENSHSGYTVSGHLREPASPEHKGKMKHPHYDILYIYTKLKILKSILEEKNIR
jgi:hypothetical protein